MAQKDYYQILNIARDSSFNEIKRVYRELVKRYHPDRNPDDSSAEERFKSIAEAYQILSNVQKRREYDRRYSTRVNDSSFSTRATTARRAHPYRPGPLNNWRILRFYRGKILFWSVVIATLILFLFILILSQSGEDVGYIPRRASLLDKEKSVQLSPNILELDEVREKEAIRELQEDLWRESLKLQHLSKKVPAATSDMEQSDVSPYQSLAPIPGDESKGKKEWQNQENGSIPANDWGFWGQKEVPPTETEPPDWWLLQEDGKRVRETEEELF